MTNMLFGPAQFRLVKNSARVVTAPCRLPKAVRASGLEITRHGPAPIEHIGGLSHALEREISSQPNADCRWQMAESECDPDFNGLKSGSRERTEQTEITEHTETGQAWFSPSFVCSVISVCSVLSLPVPLIIPTKENRQHRMPFDAGG
ncbi:MAG: hypothetical protein U0Z53_07665 [Blastocatellia bacterium]